MALHEVQLKGYSVRPGNLSLGTFDSYGIEQLHVTLDDTWSGLAVTATFNPPEGEPVEIRVPENGLIDVPAEATANEGTGTIVYCGVANGAQRISKTQGYSVITHANTGTTVPFNPSESLATQVLQAALSAEKSSADAKSVADGLRSDANNGKFNGKDGAKGDKGDTGTTPQLKTGEDNLWHVSYDNGETWVSLGVKATGDTGASGKDGMDGLTPHIGENGNWWIGDTDTGVLAKGLKGDTGAKGADGVSPTAAVTQTDEGAKFTVTDASGTTTAVVRNGVDGKNGAPGANGVSPTVQVETIDGGHRVTLTDASGAHAVDVLDGKPGKDAVVDATLTQDGQAADAKVTGEKIGELKEEIGNFKNDVNENMSFFNEFNDFNESVGLVRVNAGTAYIDSSFNRYKTITINAVSGQEFELIGSVNGAINYLVVTTDASDKVIEKYNPGVNGIVSQKTQVIAVDDNIKKIYFCFWSDSGRAVRKRALVNIEDFENKIKSYTDTKYTEAITYADNAIVKDTKNKNIVFFGTSIPAGTVKIEGVEQSIPSYMGELLHATVINESVGSSMARLGWNSSKTENDPYGWTGRAWQNVFRAMGATLEEKRDLIENYETKWRDLIGGDFEGSSGDGSGTGKPMTLTSKMESDILSWSYENKLIPYLDGTKTMPDLFIFEHGHNDYAPDMSGIPSANPDDINGYNRSLYSDVMAFYFRLIWEANPQARILIVSHYANDTEKSKRIFDAQKKCAEHNKVWFCDIANNVGWSQQKVTVNGVPKTRLEQCLPDALHPSTDTSGNAVKRESKIITNYIKAFIF